MKISPKPIQFFFPYKDKIFSGKNLKVAFAIYLNKKRDLKTGEFIECSGLSELDFYLNQKVVKRSSHLQVIHLFYEYSFLDKVQEDELIALILEFESCEEVNLNEKRLLSFSVEKQVSKAGYDKRFQRGRQHLLRGDCYQYNLTIPFHIQLKNTIDAFQLISNIWNRKRDRGAYGHATIIPLLEKSFISNSPECLFQAYEEGGDVLIETMPIKGTVKVSDNDVLERWEELKNSDKNQAELFMITDLLRNDLAKINSKTIKVCTLKAPLKVPGILHQYSKIQVRTNRDLRFRDIIKSLFPGGSITGAPKKRVIEILKELENVPRRLYCGSTIISYGKIRAASINIRTAEFHHQKNLLSYHAGGGVTLMSDSQEEWNEIQNKVDSFTRLL
jgi:anthranilate/para-aminobenzoate synthase component I